MSRWLGSGQRYLYDQGEEDDHACADDEYGEEDDWEEEEDGNPAETEDGEIHDLQPPTTDTWLLAAFIPSARQGGKRPSGAGEGQRPGSAAAEAAKKRQREAQKLAAQWSRLASTTTTETEEWHITLRSSRAELLLAFVLPQDYPPAPARVSAVLTPRESSESAGDPFISTAASTPPEPSDELYSTSVTGMLQEQAVRSVRVSALVPIAQEWLDWYTDRVVRLEQQQKEEAERAAHEALVAARAEAEALEEARRVLADGPTPFTRWLKRVGIKPPKAMRHGLADLEELFARKLALRKARPGARSTHVEPLHTLCVKVLGESLLRYESLAGYPLEMRQKILDYLVADLHLLFPEHLSVLLDDDFTSLDLSGLVSGKANKTRDEHITQVGHLCPRLKEINLSRAVRITSFSLSESIAKCLQLTRLVIDDCAQVGDLGVAVVADGCPKLIEFSARRCLSVTHNALHALGRRCTELEVVRIAGCTNIHVSGLLDLARLAKRLQVLDAAEVGNNLVSNNRDFPPVPPDRLASQRLETLILDGCNYVTRAFLQELLGPLEGQLCPCLTLICLRQCPRISNGTFEEVVLPHCPSLKSFHYSVVPHASLRGVTQMDMSHLSFLPGCRYVFPIRSAHLPPLLAQVRDQLLRGKRPDDHTKVFTQPELDKVFTHRATFLRSIERFEANAPARRALRGLELLTLRVTEWASPFSLIEAFISMPALRHLDISHANARLRDVLLSCYHFLPRLDTLVFARREGDTRDEADPAFLKPQLPWRSTTIDYYEERQRMFGERERVLLEAQQQRQRQQRRRRATEGDEAEQRETDAETKRRQWVADHIAGDDKRHSTSLTSLDLSGHIFADGAVFLDLIADRCPELRRLIIARTQGVGVATLLALLEKCVHLTHLDVRGIDLPLHGQTDLLNKLPALTLHTN